MTRINEIKQYYNRRYQKGDLGMSSRLPKSFQPLLEQMNIDFYGNYIDIGCGSGAMLISFGERGNIWGMDLSEAAISIARENQPRAKYFVGDMQYLPLGDNFFQGVSNIGGLEHAPDMKRALLEIRRICDPSGVICLVVPNKDFLLYRILPIEGTEQSVMEEHLLNLEDWISLIEESGLKIKQIEVDPGPDIRLDMGILYFFRSLVRGLFLKIARLFPIEYTYQFVFICKTSGK